jgi:ABC-type multidrug transport system fused ATPase/permease subunit
VYIFDLLLKFYEPQSGRIYVAGNDIKTLQRDTICKIFSIFNEKFGLIHGNIEDNIKIAAPEIDDEKFLKIAYSVGLIDQLDERVLDENNDDIIASQETLIRIQMARDFLRNSKILLIEEPTDSPKDSVSCDLFSDFLKFITKKKTVVLTTTNPQTIVYANKILYLGEETTLFGSHAELSFEQSYKKFMQKL